ncbi:hypothetical protein VTK56DRAFT_1699 [Thermocarpiscus australiensis]
MSTEMAFSTLLELPGEIHNRIIGQLEPMDLLMLRSTCRYFRNIIPPLNMDELLVAEISKIGIERNLYACCLCLRLRRAWHFADKMMKGPKRKLPEGGSSRHTRFCVECGLNPPPGHHGYTRGDFITRNGVVSVKCMFCTRLAQAAKDGSGKNTQWCTRCWPIVTPEGREMRRLEAARRQQEEERRQRERQEQEQRRLQRRAVWGSDAEDTDEDADEEASDGSYFETDINCMDWRDLYL